MRSGCAPSVYFQQAMANVSQVARQTRPGGAPNPALATHRPHVLLPCMQGGSFFRRRAAFRAKLGAPACVKSGGGYGPARKPTPPSRPKARAARHGLQGTARFSARSAPSPAALPPLLTTPPLEPPISHFPDHPVPPPPACAATTRVRRPPHHPRPHLPPHTTCPPLVHLPTPSLPSTQVWQRRGQAVRGVRRRWRWGPRPRRRGMPGWMGGGLGGRHYGRRLDMGDLTSVRS